MAGGYQHMVWRGNALVIALLMASASLSACTNQDALAANQGDQAIEQAAAPPMTFARAELEARRILVKEADDRRAEGEMRTAANTTMADYLFDPVSAQYRALQRGRNGAICGKVNAKNRYGAYVGFKDFVVPKDRSTVYISKYNDRLESERYTDFAQAFAENCATKREEAAYKRATTTSPYSDYSSSGLDTELSMDSNMSDDPDPFAE